MEPVRSSTAKRMAVSASGTKKKGCSGWVRTRSSWGGCGTLGSPVAPDGEGCGKCEEHEDAGSADVEGTRGQEGCGCGGVAQKVHHEGIAGGGREDDERLAGEDGAFEQPRGIKQDECERGPADGDILPPEFDGEECECGEGAGPGCGDAGVEIEHGVAEGAAGAFVDPDVGGDERDDGVGAMERRVIAGVELEVDEEAQEACC